MSNPSCPNGSLDDGNYSSPMPVIGVYVAAASLACLLLLGYDVIFAGIRPKKRWLPCKFFALNSVTLTLLSIAAKLTVDLTNPMPSRWDQLSKLTGTAFICVGMGFLVPSIGVNAESECFTNMMALSILVVTVIVNICIQLSTGVIFVFFVEHIVIMGLMLLLLLMLWTISFSFKYVRRIDVGQCNSLVTRGPDGLFERLKMCHLKAYSSNPQFKISMYPMNIAISCICVACTFIIVEATLRSVIFDKLDFCEGDSDYRWSMQYLVIIQIVTVVLASIPIVFRSVAMFSRMELDITHVPFRPADDCVKQMKKTLRAKRPNLFESLITWHGLLNLFESLITRIPRIVELLIVYPFSSFHPNTRMVCFGEAYATGYGVWKSGGEMIKLMNKVSSSGEVYQPSLYLCRKPPSQYLDLHSMIIKYGIHQIQVSTLSMALLVKMAEASISKQRLQPLLNTFQKAKEVIEYIDKVIVSNRADRGLHRIDGDELEVIHRSKYASDLWIGGDLSCLLPDGFQPSVDHRVAIETLTKLKETLRSGETWYDLPFLVNFINRRSYSSIEELCEEIEQLFADMLHSFLAKLPIAIFHCLTKTQGEEFEESVRVALKFLFQIGSFECQEKWLFPPGMSSVTADNPWMIYVDASFRKRLEKVVLVRRNP